MGRWFALVAVVLLGCGGSPKQAAPSPARADDSTQAAKKAFLAKCATRPDLDAFCACGWAVIESTVKPEERIDSLTDVRERELVGKMRGQCDGKMPESGLKERFVHDCAEQSPELAEFYCECIFTDVRAMYPSGVAFSTAAPEKVGKEIADATKACDAKASDGARKGFMKSCVEGGANEKLCECTWTGLRKEITMREFRVLSKAGGDAIQSRMTPIVEACTPPAAAPKAPPKKRANKPKK